MVDRTAAPLRVLVIAETCNPNWVSVPLVGYSLARALSERPDLDITLVTHVRNRSALEQDPIARSASLHFIDNEWLARPLFQFAQFCRGGSALAWTIQTAICWPAYLVFEKEVARLFKKQFKEGAFDLIHRVTPLSPTMGSPLASLTQVPMVIGPLNGGLPWPKDFPELRGQEREWLVPLRGMYRYLPYYSSTYRHLAAVISGSRHTATEVPRSFRGHRFHLPENGVDPTRFKPASGEPKSVERFRFITVSRLVPYKGIDLTLEAMAGSAALRNCDLCIVGDGPQKAALEALTKKRGLESNVHFLGWLEHQQLAQELARSQAFVFPSLREFGGGVVLEAMASGLPTIVVDYGGPGELVTPECGMLIPMGPRGQLIDRLRAAMETLVADSSLCHAQGQAAGRRVREEFTWAAKAGRITNMYHEILGAERTQPANGIPR